jgi:uncharacterized membrane protein YedE/YeeE
MQNFTPISALLGGLLIGAASVWLLASNGRIAGVSNIVQGMFTAPAGGWRIAFVAGLILAGIAWQAAGAPTPIRTSLPLGWVAAGGLLVGFGTRLGNGCTSGHGVCGLGRLSLRSLVAVVVFMAAGMASVYVVRHLMGVPS